MNKYYYKLSKNFGSILHEKLADDSRTIEYCFERKSEIEFG